MIGIVYMLLSKENILRAGVLMQEVSYQQGHKAYIEFQ